MKLWVTGIILLIAGICPFVIPLIGGIYTSAVEQGTALVDWLILYSFLYWPTYVGGVLLIVIAAIIFKRLRK